jgi:hypothetical protein
VKREKLKQNNELPFNTIEWDKVTTTEYPGISGKAVWCTFEMGNIRVRMVEYTPGYFGAATGMSCLF